MLGIICSRSPSVEATEWNSRGWRHSSPMQRAVWTTSRGFCWQNHSKSCFWSTYVDSVHIARIRTHSYEYLMDVHTHVYICHNSQSYMSFFDESRFVVQIGALVYLFWHDLPAYRKWWQSCPELVTFSCSCMWNGVSIRTPSIPESSMQRHLDSWTQAQAGSWRNCPVHGQGRRKSGFPWYRFSPSTTQIFSLYAGEIIHGVKTSLPVTGPLNV